MFESVKPEQVGVSSDCVHKYIKYLEDKGLSTHSVIMMRHDKVFYENYWAPFDRDFKHRIYSNSKSYVALAIGFLVQDGLVDLDEKALSYFDKEITKDAGENLKKQTVRDMLTMSTGFPWDKGYWFAEHADDRLRLYFESSSQGKQNKVPGTLFFYDSFGSFVLCALVEIVSGKSFDEFMHEKLYSKIGVARDTYTLKCPGGHSWGDSGILIRAIDQAKVMSFVMKGGEWNGEQILSRKYLEEACSKQVDNNELLAVGPEGYGYGYQIWCIRDNGFYFSGMGCQYAVAVPDKDIVFVINSDNQGLGHAQRTILDGFFEIVVNNVDTDVLPNDNKAYDKLMEYSRGLKLRAIKGNADRGLIDKINGKQYVIEENPMGITKIKFIFDGDKGVVQYTNAQGDKELAFGIDKNVFGKFPQEGYSDEVGDTYTPGHYYDCATSLAFVGDSQLSVLVQVIDKYFGRLWMRFGFNDEGDISVIMDKSAEDFMNEYKGWAYGREVK